MRPLILASASPRRRALLTALGLELEVRISNAEELAEGLPPMELVVENARLKGSAVAAAESAECFVLGADTLVELEGDILPKPNDLDEARRMIRRLAGRAHRVHTGVALFRCPEQDCATAVETTEVTFRPLEDSEIDIFVDAVRPLDRAGAYTSDGPGTLLIQGFNGCYQNVLGLPLVRVDHLLRGFGDSLFRRVDASRAIYL